MSNAASDSNRRAHSKEDLKQTASTYYKLRTVLVQRCTLYGNARHIANTRYRTALA